MRGIRWLLVCLSLGATFGAVDSLFNAASSPYSDLGALLTGTGWQSIAKVGSYLLSAGWAWAALAVAAGRIAGTPTRGTIAGLICLAAMTAAYYAADGLLRKEDFSLYWEDLRYWWLVALLVGPPLGAVGACIGRRGVAGVLAALTVPLGAAVQMALLAPGLEVALVPVEAIWARWIVWIAATVIAVSVLVRFLQSDNPATASDRVPRGGRRAQSSPAADGAGGGRRQPPPGAKVN